MIASNDKIQALFLSQQQEVEAQLKTVEARSHDEIEKMKALLDNIEQPLYDKNHL